MVMPGRPDATVEAVVPAAPLAVAELAPAVARGVAAALWPAVDAVGDDEDGTEAGAELLQPTPVPSVTIVIRITEVFVLCFMGWRQKPMRFSPRVELTKQYHTNIYGQSCTAELLQTRSVSC
jgi:hypothetical protein